VLRIQPFIDSAISSSPPPFLWRVVSLSADAILRSCQSRTGQWSIGRLLPVLFFPIDPCYLLWIIANDWIRIAKESFKSRCDGIRALEQRNIHPRGFSKNSAEELIGAKCGLPHRQGMEESFHWIRQESIGFDCMLIISLKTAQRLPTIPSSLSWLSLMVIFLWLLPFLIGSTIRPEILKFRRFNNVCLVVLLATTAVNCNPDQSARNAVN